jgi:hypothetical protein
MKRKYVFPCLMALSVASGCIKEQGEEPFLITRDDIKEYDENAKNRKENKDSIPYTLVTAIGGFANGEAKIDVVDTNTFRVFQSGTKRITNLDCYVEISSQFDNLELNGKTIIERGCVYSRTNKIPIIGPDDNEDYSKYTVVKTNSDTETSFKSGCHGLAFNSDYYLRSYAVLGDENNEPCDTIYNQRVTKIHTTLPEDVWVQRNDVSFGNRMDAISCTIDEKVYLYGGRAGSTYFNDMWVYDKDNDTWSQKATFKLGTNSHYTGTECRSNGAAFAYKPTESTDTLIYILGGEIEGKKPTDKVIFYSLTNDRYCNEQDHPNYGETRPYYYKRQKLDENKNPVYDDNGQPVMEEIEMQVTVAREYVEDLPMPICGNIAFVITNTVVPTYYVGFGKNDLGNFVSSFYQYQVNYDLEDPDSPYTHLTWQKAGDVLTNRGKTGEGLYQPVYQVCGSRIIVGTGESSKGGLSKSFYQISYNTNDRVIEAGTTMPVPENFAARANAASFYLKYTKNGEPHERFYVGTGRTYEEGSSGELLNDLWYYDFSQEKWGVARDFSNSTFCREGATGFATTRKDDFDGNVSGILTEEVRGIFTLGYGYHNESTAEKNYCKDSWEYLP